MGQNRQPVVLLAADYRQIDKQSFHVAGGKYVAAVAKAVPALPLIAPALGADSDIESLLACADGILLPGAVSNVHPSHFDQDVLNPALPLDPARDGLTLRLIGAAVEAGVPLLGICRGFQEINVAFGGSLHQAVHEQPGMADHREPDSPEQSEQYAQVHPVTTVPGGLLAEITGCSEFMVNSLHGQGIDRLGAGLVAEAHAPDGLIEAVRIAGAKSFALAVQWHPEWNVLNTPPYLAIFRAFGDACRARVAQREA
ncbi:gamma-glutamyl-gamma-aminobutyrate hydrolase [Halothiobacillus diazotrophicus]|uniref:gamma-glutamyl-gamma-aminobutyrate hydrolase n=1 Tax=Halothiobacillus diazotrophicus TaxID=1860122 RepID=A0A191ZI01_9GAMM|nr:gamma-glutamyl-gamma-aminobutyrate hydrolase family protein [Halothiobacillus diazotrophicus]ANJ67495.1 gamma-glutamyl-gamma-aminobutyrate hydrolase [Halothiobacillus diazotrophicus]